MLSFVCLRKSQFPYTGDNGLSVRNILVPFGRHDFTYRSLGDRRSQYVQLPFYSIEFSSEMTLIELITLMSVEMERTTSCASCL